MRAKRINIFAKPRRIPGIGVGNRLSTTNMVIEAAVNTERKAILFSDCIVVFPCYSYYYSIWDTNNKISFIGNPTLFFTNF